MSDSIQSTKENIVPKKIKILWVHDEFEGPVNGLAEYGGEKLWFSRSSVPRMVSSTNVPVENGQSLDLTQTRTYTLTRLTPELLSCVENNHIAYCNETGAPLNHGDPIKIRKRKQVVKADLSKIMPDGEDGIDATQRSLANVKMYNHTYDPQNIFGAYVDTVMEQDIINYHAPRRLEIC